jgi:hypothetical protein
MISPMARVVTHVLGECIESIICVDENGWLDDHRSVQGGVVHGPWKDQLERRTLLATQPTQPCMSHAADRRLHRPTSKV